MSDAVAKLKRNLNLVFIIFFVLNVLAIAVSLIGSIRTLYLFAVIGGMGAVVSILSIFRLISCASPAMVGRAGMQGLWVDCSMAIGYILTSPSSYFASSAIVWGVGLIAGIVVFFVSLYMLVIVRRTTGVPLSI
jgi:hypothetical protein